MKTTSAEDFLIDQFPRKFWHLIPSTLRTSYAAAKLMVDEEPMLQIDSARGTHGRLISHATDLAFVRLIETGQLPYDYRWRPFSKPTGKYLELRLDHSLMSISQVATALRQPRDVNFRANARLSNEPFLALPEFEDEQKIIGFPHFLLIHGHQNLNFAHLTVPHPLHNRDYCFKTQNLMKIPHEILNDRPPIENTDIDFEETNLLKEEIEKWRRDYE